MRITKHIVDKLEFPPGETVHFGDPDTWLALCGSAWFHVSNDPSRVTCTECLALLEQRPELETAVKETS